MTGVRRTVAVALAGAAAVACGSAGGRPTDAAEPVRRYVLVSGRDDHGLLELPRVPLLAQPGHHGHPHADGSHDHAAVGVPDGSIVRVVEMRGEWHLVETVTGPPARGWVDDYRLRGTARVVGDGPRCVVRVGGRTVPAGEPVEVLGVSAEGVAVRLERDAAVVGVVPRRDVRELAPSAAEACPRR